MTTTVLFLGAPTTASGDRESSELTGYGATRKAWATHHVADPNPKLIRGCCFLPKQRDGQDRYYAVLYDHGRVFMYSLHFAPRIGATLARRLMRREFPSDTRQIRTVRKATCEQIVYRSAKLKAATGSASVGVESSASGIGGRYRGIVGDVIVGPITTDTGC
jgi:hypothetical protein